jgi:hypothetical protein
MGTGLLPVPYTAGPTFWQGTSVASNNNKFPERSEMDKLYQPNQWKKSKTPPVTVIF